MAFEKYIAGFGPDGITDAYIIKILICYLVKSVGSPITKEQMGVVFQSQNLANFFDYSTCFEELIQSGHLTAANSEKGVVLTTDGKKTALILEKLLPPALREKAARGALELLAKIKRERLNRVEIQPSGEAFTVACMVLDDHKELLQIRLLVPDRNHAELIGRNFQENPEHVYRGILTLLTADPAKKETVEKSSQAIDEEAGEQHQ